MAASHPRAPAPPGCGARSAPAHVQGRAAGPPTKRKRAAANPGTPPAPPRRPNGAIPTSRPPDRRPAATGPKESPAWDG